MLLIDVVKFFWMLLWMLWGWDCRWVGLVLGSFVLVGFVFGVEGFF